MSPTQTKSKGPSRKQLLERHLPERRHLEGCPCDPDDLEWHDTQATTGKYAGKVVRVYRCVRCAAQTEVLAPSDDEESEEL